MTVFQVLSLLEPELTEIGY